MAHKETKPVSTFHPEDGHRGTLETETPGIKRRMYHAGNPDTSGESELPEGGTLPIHQREKAKRER
jgi:hypothetical protein